MPPTSPRSRISPAALGVLAVVAVLGAAIGVVIVGGAFGGSRAAQDQDNYHLRAVRTFAQDWQRPDFSDYRSATTPGYHLALAAVSKFVSDDTRVVRAAGAVFTLGLVLTLGMVLVRVSPGAAGALVPGLLTLPLACSLYVFSAGAWILPDNAGWWGVLGVLALVLRRPVGSGMLAVAGLVLLALVLCRQTHLWAAGLVWMAPWLGSLPSGDGSSGAGAPERRRWKLIVLAVLATVPAFVAVGAFAYQWRGLVPPLFQGGVFDPVVGKTSPRNSGGNAATPAFLLTLAGLFGVFFLGYARGSLRAIIAADRRTVVLVAIGAGVGLLAGLIPATSLNPELGRYTGFWRIAQTLPVVADRSLFIGIGACGGGAVLALFLAGVPRRDAWILLAAVAGFGCAQSAAFFAWQRYLEPFVLILLSILSARAAGDEPVSTPWRTARRLGPGALALLLAAITWAGLREPARQADTPRTYAPPGMHPAPPPAEERPP